MKPSYELYRNYRDKMGCTDYAVSKATGVPTSCICDWHKGRANPRTEKLFKIAKFLGCSIEDLIEEDE